MTGARRIVLDVDTGIDDALALLYAVTGPALDLRGVTTVVGNVPAEVAARNSAAVLAHVGAGSVPVATGARRTSSGGGPRTGRTSHGPDGLGGVEVAPGPDPSGLGARSLLDTTVAGGPVTLVGLAPMTNVAELAPAAADLVLVAGELVVKDTPEPNAGHDPAATARVLAASRPTTLYVADVFAQVAAHPDDVARLRSSSRPAARLAGELLTKQAVGSRPRSTTGATRGHRIGDAGALVLLTHPDLFRVEPRRMGMVGDRLTETTDGRLIDVVVGLDAAAVSRAFVDVLLDA